MRSFEIALGLSKDDRLNCLEVECDIEWHHTNNEGRSTSGSGLFSLAKKLEMVFILGTQDEHSRSIHQKIVKRHADAYTIEIFNPFGLLQKNVNISCHRGSCECEIDPEKKDSSTCNQVAISNAFIPCQDLYNSVQANQARKPLRVAGKKLEN